MVNNDLTVHMIVKNEDQWVWYAIKSIISLVNVIFIYDTGSSDNTIRTIKSFPQAKINIIEKGACSPNRLVQLRQEQLLRTKTDWFMLLDGDEVWPNDSLISVLSLISHAPKDKMAVVVRSRNCVGDILHYQDENAGRYTIAGKTGHYNIRFYRNSGNYSWKGKYPNEAYTDNNGIKIQDQQDNLLFGNAYYWHLTHLKRSSKFPNPKLKYEIGIKADINQLPEAFRANRPGFVPDPWIKYSSFEQLAALILTPLRKIKRNLYSC